MKSKKLKRSRNKKNIRYSGWREIPSGNAPEEITQGCLVLEGGAFRGLYSQGVLDALMENGINMYCTIGVSAGALAGFNYVAGQIGRSARANLRFHALYFTHGDGKTRFPLLAGVPGHHEPDRRTQGISAGYSILRYTAV